jgi:hypothetical protein
MGTASLSLSFTLCRICIPVLSFNQKCGMYLTEGNPLPMIQSRTQNGDASFDIRAMPINSVMAIEIGECV